MMGNFLIVLIGIFSFWIGVLIGDTLWEGKEVKPSTPQCELTLPRNQECTMVFIAPKKLSNDKTTTEVGHSIPK